ncbi:MAG: hypothetical protein MK165_09550 [Pirellulaceae bacterium]|nr:hypothetical protein [Pirellulaceae bacterium]
MTLRNDQIPAESRIGLVALHASAIRPASTLARIRGELLNEGAKQNRYAKTPAGDMASYRTQQREQLGIAVTEPAKVGLAWSPAMESLRLLRGTRLPVELMVLRSEETASSFRVRLLTTQATQKKTINKNKQTSQVDDLERSLRLDGDPVFEPAATTAVVHLLVPADLPDGKFGVAFVAELLSPDKKTVIARSSTAVRNLETGSPLSIELAISDVVEAKSGRGESGILSGQVTRAPGFQQPITVTLTSLPRGIVAPRQRLAADQTEFALRVGLPFGMKPGALTGIQLVETVTVALERPSRRIQSNRIPISLQIVAGEKPLAESPWEVFEDAPEFAGYFSQGTGQVSLDTSQPYAGTASLKITPSSRSNANIPSLGLKIRERPATGEYRYLRWG